jgi:two-component system, response regulator RegA
MHEAKNGVTNRSSDEGGARPKLLIIEDDARVSEYLFRFIATLGYEIQIADHFDAALEKAQARPPDHVLLDVRIPGGSGLSLIRPLRDVNPKMRIVLCTAYPSIATSVAAMKLGADDYLPKPVTPEQILAAFGGEDPGDSPERTPSEGRILSLARSRWEYINMVLANCDGNVAAAARQLGIHRQSLQRMLKKLPPST